jgi:hypothetical protein
MVPCRLAHADIQAICATIAANSTNPMATNVDVWLTRFRGSYAACLSQHEVAGDARVEVKTAVKPGKTIPAEICIEQTFSKPKQKNKRVIPKTSKKSWSCLPGNR